MKNISPHNGIIGIGRKIFRPFIKKVNYSSSIIHNLIDCLETIIFLFSPHVNKTINTDILLPTGTTRQVLSAIANGIGASEIKGYDLTPPGNREHFNFSIQDSDELILIGVPVYEEFVPQFLWDCLNAIEGKNKPIVLVAVYGNIGFGMCLKEMADWAKRAGFRVIAAAAFVGEHSFSHKETPLAEGRPDNKDQRIARKFGAAIAKKIKNGQSEVNNIPGHIPIMARVLPKNSAKLFAKYPDADMALCTHCMRCLNVCPSAAIDPGTLNIDKTKCLHCFACVRVCAPKARQIEFKLKALVKNVLTLQTAKRNEPELFI